MIEKNSEKRINMLKKLSLKLLLLASLLSFQRSYSYECCENPLICGALDVQAQVGVMPIMWNNRGPFQVVLCDLEPPLGPIITAFELSKFSKFYKTPWIIGGQIGYSLYSNVRIYGEINYGQANAKTSPTFNLAIVPGETVVLNLTKYSLVDAYFGGRYYFDRWCNRVSFFLGAKVGLIHHRKINFNLAANVPDTGIFKIASPITFYNSNTLVSGGFSTGLDACLCDNLSLVFNLDIVANCGFRNNNPIASLNGPDGLRHLLAAEAITTQLLVSGIGTEIRFPITIGLRYSF